MDSAIAHAEQAVDHVGKIVSLDWVEQRNGVGRVIELVPRARFQGVDHSVVAPTFTMLVQIKSISRNQPCMTVDAYIYVCDIHIEANRHFLQRLKTFKRQCLDWVGRKGNDGPIVDEDEDDPTLQFQTDNDDNLAVGDIMTIQFEITHYVHRKQAQLYLKSTQWCNCNRMS